MELPRRTSSLGFRRERTESRNRLVLFFNFPSYCSRRFDIHRVCCWIEDDAVIIACGSELDVAFDDIHAHALGITLEGITPAAATRGALFVGMPRRNPD